MIRYILALAGLLLAAMPAAAQTSPGWTAGQVPTAAQWNAEWASKADTTALSAEIARATSAEAAITAAAPGLAPVQSVAGQTGAVTNLSAGKALATGSTTARTLAARAADTINVLDFGAKGDGVTDDTLAIQAAALACPAAGCTLQFPAGRTYSILGLISLPSHATVSAYGAKILALSGKTGPIFQNVSHSATTLTDSDIKVLGGTLDYGSSGAGGGSHAIEFVFVDGVTVQDVTFLLHGAGDAVAGIGTAHVFLRGNRAYDATNCPYDFWWSPRDVHVIGNFASSTSTSQMVNFNPEKTNGDSTGLVADGLVLSDNIFECTGSSACPLLLSPLSGGTYVQHVTVAKNVLKNVSIVLRGAVSDATVTGNVMPGVRGGGSAIASYPYNSGTPNTISIVGNTVPDANTSSSSQGVIRAIGTNTTISGNTISGSSHYAGLYVGSGVVVGPNSISYGANGYYVTGTGWTSGTDIEGVNVGKRIASTGAFTTLSASGLATFTASARFSGTGSYSDPDAGVTRDAKFGQNGIAVVGGTKTDTLNVTGAAKIVQNIASGSAPTLSGTCSTGTQVGGNSAGSFHFSSACSAGTVILTFASAAPNGWACHAQDMTTPADTLKQTAYSTTSATFTATAASGDQAVFQCTGF